MKEHLSQVELIQFIDGELIELDASHVQAHLSQCNDCKMALIETRLLAEELKQFQCSESSIDMTESGREEARSRLQAKLAEAHIAPAELSSGNRALSDWWRLPTAFYWVGMASAGIALVFLFFPNLYKSGWEISASLPNHALTPGMVRPMSLDSICSSGDDDDFDPAVSDSMRRTIFREYGISVDHSRNDFQVDYLISPQLGGTDDVQNLWPQSYKATRWNAVAKDKLERHLHQLVCEKKIDLADAQRDIATNWIAAYQKYFRTRRPI